MAPEFAFDHLNTEHYGKEGLCEAWLVPKKP